MKMSDPHTAPPAAQPGFDARALWRTRFAAYRQEALGYLQYAARSNFFLLLAFLAIVSSYYYAKSLQRLPTNYPYWWIAVALLAPVLAHSPIRTLLRPADRAFLLPASQRLGPYFRSGLIYSGTLQALVTTLALVALWPLYRHCAGPAAQPFGLLLPLLLVLKAANLLGAWHETRLAYQRARAGSALYRWLAAVAALLLLFLSSPLAASAAALLFTLGWLAAVRRAAALQIGWDHLLARERQQQARLYAFFSWFVDVPQLPARIVRRRWISGITRLLPFRQDAFYAYLYGKTLLRTELLGICLRLTLLGALAVAALSSEAARFAAFLITPLITAVQLGALNQAHRYTFWLQTYPLDRSAKPGAVARIVWLALLAQTAALTVPLLLTSGAPALWAPPVSLAASALLCGVHFRRKFRQDG